MFLIYRLTICNLTIQHFNPVSPYILTNQFIIASTHFHNNRLPDNFVTYIVTIYLL